VTMTGHSRILGSERGSCFLSPLLAPKTLKLLLDFFFFFLEKILGRFVVYVDYMRFNLVVDIC
jgi:hypothetical protein